MDKLRLVRGSRREVSNLLSSFGNIKETRVSSILGYVLSLELKLCLKIFKVKPVEIFLEFKQLYNRYDIVLKDKFDHEYKLEVKLFKQNIEQLKKYGENTFIIGGYSNPELISFIGKNNCFSWYDLINLLLKYSEYNDSKFLIYELKKYLLENNIMEDKTNEIYCRMISGDSLKLYYKYNFYHSGNPRKDFNTFSTSKYFAPYITQKSTKSDNYDPLKLLQIGISTISKIKQSVLLTGKDLSKFLKPYYRYNEISDIIKLTHINKEDEYGVLILGNPFRVLQIPLDIKDLLGVKRGNMNKKYFTFEEIFDKATEKQKK